VIEKILLSIFVLAGLCEIGGGYMIWLWLREHKPWWFGVIGGLVLILYGIVATLQPANFGRVFVILAILGGWKVDSFVPDKFDMET